VRVVAGIAGGIPLETPGTGLRPSMDKVKAAMFSSLGERVPGARVLDLFAGSGALGIEALSRGAREAVFVEKDRRAALCIGRNLAKTRVEGGRVVNADVFRYLRGAAGGERFDLIFADPPYAAGEESGGIAGRLTRAPELLAVLEPGGCLVLERASGGEAWSAPGWELLRARRYGAAEVVFAAPSGGGAA